MKKWAVYQSASKIDYSMGFHDEPAGFVFAEAKRQAVHKFASRVYIEPGHWAKLVLVND